MSAHDIPPAEDPLAGGLDNLAATASQRHVVVIGAGVSGLVAAMECGKLGMRVTVLDAAETAGGAIRTAVVDGIRLDAGAESYATRGGHVRALVDELGLSDQVVLPHPEGAWLSGIPGIGAAPLPKGGLLGIPENPFREDVRRILGWGGTWRAYLDRIRPPLTIGQQRSLGQLVASRMGPRVRDRLVAPVTAGVYSAHPDDIDVNAALPGLNALLTQTGSLAGAVAARRAESATAGNGKPGAAVSGLRGGMGTLVEALVARVTEQGGQIRLGSAVRAIRREESGWVVELDADDAEVAGAAADPEASTAADDQSALAIAADGLVVATEEAAARTLLAQVVPALAQQEMPEAPRVEVITLVLDAPALDTAPRGTGVLAVPGSHRAKALTHATVKWAWLREQAEGRHVVRISFGSQGEEPETARLDDAQAAALALQEAAALLGVPQDALHLRAAHRERFAQSQPPALRGAAERRASARAAFHAVPNLAVMGAWLAGTGLAQVVPDARAETDRLRRALLWG